MVQILLVDDSELMRRYVARTLEMMGIEFGIREASNGREAIDKARDIRPDVIITDLNMPEMNGEELVARVAGDPELGGIPILVLSADHSAGSVKRLIHGGAVAYLTKPVTPEDLKIRLLQMMGDKV
jgi:two-component system chemotaxis response regulator CheY